LDAKPYQASLALWVRVADDFTPASDRDVLVEFEPGARIGFFDFQDIEDEPASLLSRKVDLNTPASPSTAFRAEVLHEARPLYVAA
jgi:hypothetical protein